MASGTTVIAQVPSSIHHHRPHVRRLGRYSTVVPATVFSPQDPTLTPEEHFPLQTVQSHTVSPYPRFVNRFDSREILVIVDGSCVNNGRHPHLSRDPVGGCSFMFKGGAAHRVHDPSSMFSDPEPDSGGSGVVRLQGPGPQAPGKIAFQLERRGPRGEETDATSNRAKLRAVIAALQFRAWGFDGWRRVVVLTDLEYVVEGATRLLPAWAARRWRAKGAFRRRIANRDLWEELQARVEVLRAEGCEVSFWLVGRRDGAQSEVLQEAKLAARMAARVDPDGRPDDV